MSGKEFRKTSNILEHSHSIVWKLRIFTTTANLSRQASQADRTMLKDNFRNPKNVVTGPPQETSQIWEEMTRTCGVLWGTDRRVKDRVV